MPIANYIEVKAKASAAKLPITKYLRTLAKYSSRGRTADPKAIVQKLNSLAAEGSEALDDILVLKMVRPPRFERGTLCLEGRCSIQLSYGRSILL